MAALSLVAAAAAAWAPVPAGRAQEAESRARLVIQALTPVLQPGGALTVTGAVVNSSNETLRDVRVRLRVGPVVSSRSALGRSSGRTATLGSVALSDLSPGGLQDFTAEVTAAQITDRRLLSPAVNTVRSLAVEVLADGVEVGRADTYVVWWPKITRTRTPMLWVWPLVERTHRILGVGFSDDDLAASVQDGRLADLLTVGAGSRLPLVWAVDPELLASLLTMTRGYTVRGEDGRPRAGERGETATAWLARARAALATNGSRLIVLPYADPDVVALERAGRGDALADRLRSGRESLAAALGPMGGATSNVSWPPAGQADEASVDRYAAAGASAVVLAGSALPAPVQTRYTPTAVSFVDTTSGRTLPALAADEALSTLVAAGPGPGGGALALQRFRAETAVLYLEQPSRRRVVVITPPRSWAADPAYAAGLLALTAGTPWLEPIGLEAALSTRRDTVDRTLTYPMSASSAEVSAAHLAAVQAVRTDLARLEESLTEEGGTASDIAEALDRAESAQVREAPGIGDQLVAAAAGGLREQISRLAVSTGGVVTMTSREGRIPITIVNNLGQVVRARVVVESNNRLEIRGVDTQPREIPTGTSTFEVRAVAQTSGLFSVRVRLLPPGTDVELTSATLRVRSTAYGRAALLITGGAFCLLLLAASARLVRRRRRARAATT